MRIAAKRLTAGLSEIAGVFDADFLERLQAVGGKARHDDGEALDAAPAKFAHGFGRIGLQPFGAAETGLKRL